MQKILSVVIVTVALFAGVSSTFWNDFSNSSKNSRINYPNEGFNFFTVKDSDSWYYKKDSDSVDNQSKVILKNTDRTIRQTFFKVIPKNSSPSSKEYNKMNYKGFILCR